VRTRKLLSRVVMGCLVALVALPAGGAFAQTRVRPGFNLFSVEQDQEIGVSRRRKWSASSPSSRSLYGDLHQRDREAPRGRRPGGPVPYQFKVVNRLGHQCVRAAWRIHVP